MQRITNINLNNLKKCNQVWDDMLESERGRICQKCQETIIDFRNLKKSEIAEIHTFTNGKVCGLYRKEQLRGIEDSDKLTLRFKSIFVGILGFIATLNTKSQAEIPINKVEKTETLFNTSNQITQYFQFKESTKDSIVITGTIKDEYGNSAIYASVFIEGTKIGTTSDEFGNYSINVSESLDTLNEISLIFAYIGYNDEKKQLLKKDLLSPNKRLVDVTLRESPMISFYIIEKQPLHKRIWNGIKNIFKKEK
jgi:CarboxypepD_reg-like domain